MTDPLQTQFLRQLGRVEGLLDAARILQDEALKIPHGDARGMLMLSAAHLARIAKERLEALKKEYAQDERTEQWPAST